MKLSVVLAAVLAFAGCEGTTTVGRDLTGGTGGPPVIRITPEPASTDPAGTPTSSPAPRASQQRVPRQTSTPQPSVEFSITNDGFAPNVISIYRDGSFKLTNRASEARSVRETDDAFESPQIEPGQSWTFTVDLPPGTYTLQDADRPYVVATLQVVAR